MHPAPPILVDSAGVIAASTGRADGRGGDLASPIATATATATAVWRVRQPSRPGRRYRDVTACPAAGAYPIGSPVERYTRIRTHIHTCISNRTRIRARIRIRNRTRIRARIRTRSRRADARAAAFGAGAPA